MKFSAAIDEFLCHLRVERGRARNTLIAYERDLRALAAWLANVPGAEDPALERVSSYALKDWLASLRDEGEYRPRSLARTMSTLRVFFDHWVRVGELDVSPAAGLHNPKVPKALPVYLVPEEIERLLRAPDVSDSVGVRDRAMLVTFLYTGLRLSELAGLRLASIDRAAGFIRVLGKGSKERLVPLHDAVAETLAEYERNARPTLAADGAIATDVLFLNEKGEPVTSRAVGWAVGRAVQRAGLSRRITPHKLRHTFATQLLHRGASLVDIKDLLGHAHIATTSIYTHTTVERLRSAVEKIDEL